uniref:Uncharacterized protein n=1 Tax=Oryza brachyantha TaxID=4533 RepID=J3LL66_ORYBR
MMRRWRVGLLVSSSNTGNQVYPCVASLKENLAWDAATPHHNNPSHRLFEIFSWRMRMRHHYMPWGKLE